jgi:hypothetical protein
MRIVTPVIIKFVPADSDFSSDECGHSFKGQQTTTEFLSLQIFDGLAEAARTGALGPGGEGIKSIRVTLHESHVARA